MMRAFALACLAARAAALAVTKKRVALASGQTLEWLTCAPPNAKTSALCIHGTFHGAWCFAETWLERLAAEHGVAAHAVSLRGTSGSPCAEKSVTLSQHAADVAEAVALEFAEPPFLVAHSFGGPVALDAIANGLDVAGVALLCSVPPSGNKPGTARVVRRSLREAWLITKAFALKTAATDRGDANAVFFNGELGDAAAERYRALLFADSRKGLDLGDYQRSLPRWPAVGGRWAAGPPDLKSLVVGCGADRVVDAEALAETAAFLGVEPVVLPGAPHDLMLAPSVEKEACDVVGKWLVS